jgi:protein-L-isoaspartate O-methyltransferase
MEAARAERIEETYEKHPQSAAAILDRIRRQRGGLLGITEMDLARDDDSFLTDQNHTGGLDADIRLAQAIKLTSDHRVLDIGTGLGGTPRALAFLYGCHCHGVELTESRYDDAVKLTDLVGLSDLVTFSCGDFASLEIPDAPYDVVIGQAAFMHFSDQRQSLQKCNQLLAADGALIVEDGYLRHPPQGARQSELTQSAWAHWNGRFRTLDEWKTSLHQSGFEPQSCEDQTDVAVDEYQQQFRIVRESDSAIEPGEVEGWYLGRALIRDGVIGMMRLICRNRPK